MIKREKLIERMQVLIDKISNLHFDTEKDNESKLMNRKIKSVKKSLLKLTEQIIKVDF